MIYMNILGDFLLNPLLKMNLNPNLFSKTYQVVSLPFSMQ